MSLKRTGRALRLRYFNFYKERFNEDRITETGGTVACGAVSEPGLYRHDVRRDRYPGHRAADRREAGLQQEPGRRPVPEIVIVNAGRGHMTAVSTSGSRS